MIYTQFQWITSTIYNIQPPHKPQHHGTLPKNPSLTITTMTNATRIPYLPGNNPLQCPLCKQLPLFPNEWARNIHYFQHHILKPENRHPPRALPERIPSLPGNPLKCPVCKHLRRFTSEASRDLHYFQDHILKAPHARDERPLDGKNQDGPLGKSRHVFDPEKYCREPGSYTEGWYLKSS